ncbi:MAG: phosphatidylglycerol lysyltransferase domain-containing protein [Methanomicrobiales archaeon]|nr:phosphatidylglycerol lysyltransferase domain-containing protein [Methanomicrobiales archaeon]
MADILDFFPVTLGEKELFQTVYRSNPPDHSDNNFTNMVCWNHYAHYEYAYSGGCIILKSTIDGKSTFRPPIGPENPEILRAAIACAIDDGNEEPLAILGKVARERVLAQFPDLPLIPMWEFYDYVYRSTDLAALPGKQYLSIRRQLHRFRKSCNYTVEGITAQILPEIKEFLEKWCEWKECDSVPVLANEKEAIFFGTDHFLALGLSGLIIRVDGVVAAMEIFQELNPTTTVVHFEKGLPDCEGIYKAINNETAKILQNSYAFINREADMGVEGLRQAKMRYHPHHMVEVYHVHRDDLMEHCCR